MIVFLPGGGCAWRCGRRCTAPQSGVPARDRETLCEKVTGERGVLTGVVPVLRPPNRQRTAVRVNHRHPTYTPYRTPNT